MEKRIAVAFLRCKATARARQEIGGPKWLRMGPRGRTVIPECFLRASRLRARRRQGHRVGAQGARGRHLKGVSARGCLGASAECGQAYGADAPGGSRGRADRAQAP
ncbi:hypothetical protein PIB30_058049 [Stylosanthes scabra]|uniref:Uncharacterized protein n=1 Tax=Stylosanthes scabra TaxID=79078 RepID=A0ABU6XLF5_9FABA|nr:hypothetical protein [Stylosanthes scabra]